MRQFRFIGVILLILLLPINSWCGSWAGNGFTYRPSYKASGLSEYNNFDTALERVDARLGKQIWVGDPNYGTTLQTAITAIDSTACTLHVPPGTHSISADLTVPANILLEVHRGATLAIATTKTLTISGPLRAGPYQIFSWEGTGAIQINGSNRFLLAEWFGASTSSGDNGPAVQKAVASFGTDSGPGGGTLVFGHGNYTFTSPAVSGTAFASDITFQGQGNGAFTDLVNANGTRLKYAGTETLFPLAVPLGVSQYGWQWRDMSIYCTSTGNAIEMNDTDLAATQVGGFNNWSLRNVSLLGTGGDIGLGVLYGFDGFTDNNFSVQGFKWGVYLVDSDGCEINGRATLNNQHVRIVTKTAFYGNENRVRMRLMPLADYGDDRYLIYDTVHGTKYEHQQYEGGASDYCFYLNGYDTAFDNPYFSGEYAGRIGPDARLIRFISPKGGVGNPLVVDTPTYYMIGTTGFPSDYCIYFHDPSAQYRPAIPVNPRIVVMADPHTNEYDSMTSGANRAEAQAYSLPAMMGRPQIQSTSFLINALLKGYRSDIGAISWEADNNALFGWALKVPCYWTTQYGLFQAGTEGINISATDTFVVTVRYRASDTPTEGATTVHFHGSTSGFDVGDALPVATTSYQTATVIKKLSGIIPGETVMVGVLHALQKDETRLDLYVDYMSIVPYAQSIFSHAFVMRKQDVDYAATVTPDWSKGAFLVVGQLTDAVQLANPSVAAIEGQKVYIKLNADGTNRAVTYGDKYKAAYAQVTANKTAVVEFLYDGTNYIQVGAVQEN